MKNNKKTVFLFVLIISFALMLTGCGKKKELSFEVNGGSPIETVKIDAKEEYTLPTPTRDGYEFAGWYLTSDFTGESITVIIPTENVTVYAKWNQLFKITLDPAGGSISTTTVYGKTGDSVLDLVKTLVPTKDGMVFGAWFNGNLELNENSKITNKDITLTAKYKVEYTVNVYKEKLTHDGYDKEEIKNYDYVGKKVSYELDSSEGFTEVEKDDTVDEITISENKSNNVLTLYFNRDYYTVTLRSNYPGSVKSEETVTINLYYGEEVDLPEVGFSIDGYYLLGFSDSATGDVIYDAHMIDNLPVNKEEDTITKDKISVNRTSSLYAIWNKGYKDMFGGDDYIFVASDKKTAYLERAGIYFIGEFFTSDNSFIFYNDKENLEGRVYTDGTYAYYNVSRDEYSAVLYTVGSGLDESIKVLFDPYNGITYYDGNQDADKRESKGTYTIDENNFYHVTFTEGLKAGETMIIIVGRVTADYVTTDAFQLRNEEEYEMGSLVRFTIVNSTITYYLYAYQIELSGFGTLTYNTGETTETYYYSYDEEKDMYKIATAEGSNFGTIKLITNDGVKGYMFYDETMDQTFTASDGSTLVLDGVYNATYTSGTTSVTGTYVAKQSVFGGNIVRLKANNTEYTFLTSSKTEEGIIGTEGEEAETITTYSFIVKPNGYDEYYYKDEQSIYYAPLVVINDTEEGMANVYGYTPNRTFELILEGTYVFDENTDLYVFTTTKIHNNKVMTNPVDIKTIKSFVFKVDSEITQYSINYWYSSTTDSETVDYKKEYKNNDNSSVLLVNGIAILSKDGYVITGTYSTRNGVTTISNQHNRAYVELNNDDMTFITLEHAPYNAYIVVDDGSYSTKLHMEFDGKGGAKYVYYETLNEEEVEKFYSGTVTKTTESTRQGIEVYEFQSAEKTFKYLLIHTDYASFVYPNYSSYSGSYSSSDGILYLDGYLNYVSYTDPEGDEYIGSYIIEGENLIKATFDSKVRYFDVNNRSFTIRGIEYGTYIIVENQGTNNVYVDLDGYGQADVYKLDGDNKTVIDSASTYIVSNDKYTLTYTDNTTDITLVGYLGSYHNDGVLEDAFVIEKQEFVHTYINNKDWSVLKIDSKGRAIRADNKGISDEGTYIIITDDLLYFENDEGTYANIYKYSNTTNSITESKYVPRGYYTQELKSLLFTQYGFAVFNFNTKYFYNITNDGVVIYHQDVNNPNANKYGYVEENFGAFDNVKEYNGDTYYQNDGFAINFTRVEATKDLYPVLVIKNPETRAPLEKLSFSPTGNDTFRSQGTVDVGPYQGMACTVVREYVDDHYEMYVLVGYYRFDITVHFSGKNEDGSSNSTYEVTGMSCSRIIDSYRYLDNYYMYYIFYGQSFVSTYENNFGQVKLLQYFNETGEMTDDYVVIDFKDDTKALDLNGNLIGTQHASYDYQENGGMNGNGDTFTVEFEAGDGYTYKVYILLQNHGAFNRLGYIIYAVTRLETITSGDYKLEVERIITSDYNFPIGAYYNVKMSKGDTELLSKESFEIDDVLHYVARTYDDDENITSTTYYKLDLVLKDSESLAEDVVVPVDSVTVTELEAHTYYTEDKESYVDVLDSKIVLVSVDGVKSLVSECTYNTETGEYKVTLTSLKEYTVKIEDGVMTITEVQEEIEEVEENNE